MAVPERAERRTLPRFDGHGLEVWIRPQGRLVRLAGVLQDFNRHGFALIIDEQIAKDVQVFVSLAFEEVCLDNVVGVVHNCIAVDSGFRAGIQFRTKSDLQFDQNYVESVLQHIEAVLGKDLG